MSKYFEQFTAEGVKGRSCNWNYLFLVLLLIKF